jgi:hypothetical protein
MFEIEVKTAKSPQDYDIIRNLIRAYSEWLGIVHLYKEFGFSEIPAYYHNPNEDVIYMSLDLSKTNHR